MGRIANAVTLLLPLNGLTLPYTRTYVPGLQDASL